MADSLLFNGSSDYINFSPGNVVGSGAFSCVAIVKLTADAGAYKNIIGWNSIDAGWGLDNQNPGRSFVYPGTGPTVSTFTYSASEGWVLLAFSKPVGSGTVGRHHKYVYGTTTWTHQVGQAIIGGEFPTCARLIVGCRGDLAGNFMDANVLIVGWWDSELSDGTIETLISGTDAWTTASPTEAWRLNTTGSIGSFVGTSTESARSGTTLDTGDAPAGWSDGGPLPQTLRPDADVTTTGWTTTPLWSKIEESSADGTVVTATAS